MLSHLRQLKKLVTHPANRSRPVRSVIRAVRWRLGPARRGERVAVRVFGYSIELEPERAGTRGVIYFTDHSDFDHVSFIKRYLRPGDAFVDVGANIGLYTLLAASRVGPTGVIHAFEPVPETFASLEKNVRSNKVENAVLHRTAIGERHGSVEFTDDRDIVNHVSVDEKTDLLAGSHCVEVPLSTLDSTLPKNHQWAMWKIDTEGYELHVLRGASESLQGQSPPVISVEVNGSGSRYGVSRSDVVTHLARYGYRPSSYSATENRLTFTAKAWDDVIFVRESAVELVRDRLGCTCSDN